MEILLVIGAIALFIFAAPIISLIRTSNLQRKVDELEKKIAELAKKEIEPRVREEVPTEKTMSLGPPAPYISRSAVEHGASTEGSQPEIFGTEWSDRFVDWLKEDWLLKLGALLILIGFGWFVTYAFLHDWIGPEGRIGLGLLAGVLIMAFGFSRIRSYLNQGGVFIVLGGTTILLTTFAARQIYNFFTPGFSLLLMYLTAGLVAFASVRYKSRNLAFSGLILASVAPLLTNSTDYTHIYLFLYLMVVVLATLWVVVLRGWRELVTAALMIVAAYSLPDLLGSSGADPHVILFFIYSLAAIFFATHTLGMLKQKGGSVESDLVTASLNGLLLLVWIWTAAPPEWRGSIYAVWMLIFAAGGLSIFSVTGRREPFYAYLGVSVAMLAAATAAEFNGAVLTIAYTIESVFIPAVSYAVLRKREESESLFFLLVGPILLSLQSLDLWLWGGTVLNKHFFVLLILSLSLFGLGGFFAWVSGKEKIPRSSIATISLVLGSLYAYALIWLSLHAALDNAETAVMISLVIYTIVGLLAYFYGRLNEVKGFLTYGGALLAFVVGRLLLIDVWQMDLTRRIITFFLIGALLVSTAFIGRAKERRTV